VRVREGRRESPEADGAGLVPDRPEGDEHDGMDGIGDHRTASPLPNESPEPRAEPRASGLHQLSRTVVPHILREVDRRHATRAYLAIDPVAASERCRELSEGVGHGNLVEVRQSGRSRGRPAAIVSRDGDQDQQNNCPMAPVRCSC